MKKRIISILLVVVMVVAMIPAAALSTFAEDATSNDAGYHVAYTDTAIEVDGAIDDAYLAGTKIEINNLVSGSDKGTGGYAYLAYDDENLYIAVQVNDTTVDSGDKVNLMLDWLYDETLFNEGKAKHGTGTNSTYKSSAYYTSPNFYLGHADMSRGATAMSAAWMFNAGCVDRTAKTAENENGYVVEFRIVWEGNVTKKLLAEKFDFGVSLIVFDGTTQYSNGIDAYDTGFRYNMFPKATITKVAATKGNVAHTDTPIEADGIIDDVYYLGEKIEINNLVAGTDKGTSGYAYMAYDQNYLYIAVYVSDSTDDGTSDYVALTLDWLYDAELLATGAANYKKADHWTAPNYYLGYAQIGRDHENTSSTWHAWMFDAAKVLPTKRSAAVASSTDYTVEFKIPWKGNAKTDLLATGALDFGAGIVIYDKGTEVSNGNQDNATNKAFTGEMLPKFTIVDCNGYEAKHATERIYENSGVDGVIEDSYYAGTKIPVNNVVSGSDTGTSGTAYMTYDENNIYIAIDVKDSTNGGSADYVALTIDLLYDAEIFKTGASNYKNSIYYASPYFYLGYINLARDGSANTNAWMFGSGTGYSRKQVATDDGYIVEFRVELRGNARADFFKSEEFNFGVGITIFDGSTQISNGTQTNDINMAFTGDMLPKMTIRNEGNVLNRADGTISVDGVMDDAYLGGYRYDINALASGSATTAAGSYAYIVYDDTAIYVYVYSADTTVDSTDRIHFYVDWRYDIDLFNQGASAYKNNAAYNVASTAYLGYYESSRSGGASRNWMFATSVIGLDANYKTLTASGYTAEYKLTWKEIGLANYQAAEDFELGIAIHIVDGSTHYSNSTINTKDQTQALDGAMYPKYVIKKGTTTTDSTDVAYSNDELVLDGEIDGAYLDSTPVQLNYYHGGDGTTGNSLGTSKAYMAFTDNALYLIVDMKDKTVFNNGYTGKASDGNVLEGIEILVDFFRATATPEQLAQTGTTYKTTASGAMGYFRSTYKHNVDTDTYTVNNWENYWMWGSYANLPQSAVKVVDGGYRLEYKIAYSTDIAAKIASMSAGESVEIGLGIRMRDDITDDGVANRYNVFGSCPTLDPGNNPRAVYSYTLTKGEATSEMTGANVSLGEDITVNYYSNFVQETTEAPKMLFTRNGKKTVVSAIYDGVENSWKFEFEGIAPQCMGDNVEAKLIVDGEFVDVKEEYSVLTYCKNKLGTSDKLDTLIYDLLAYGAAAQVYADYKTDALVNAGYEANATVVDSITNNDKNVGAAFSEDTRISGAGVYFASVNRLYIKIKAEDVADVTVTINGQPAVIEKYSAAEYIVYSEGITVANFDKVYTFVLESSEGEQTLTYSVNAYASVKYNSTNEKTAALAKALYAYGCSAEQYRG